MKKLVLKSLIIFAVLIISPAVFAVDNVLNSVLLEKVDSSYNVVLRSDFQTKVNKKVKSDNEIDITLKNIQADSSLPITYRNVASESSVVVLNNGRGEVKLHITSPEVSKSNVIFDTPNASPTKVNTNSSLFMILAGFGALMALLYANKISAKKPEFNFDLNIKDREMKLLKKYREELTTIPSINTNMKNCGYPRIRANASVQGRSSDYAQKV